jgi:Fur family ferric uptake transcriptional regulator|tara:strand:- start:8906 stop:9349 length:444 start_codon:yes stop_codon:yes gene_type:complete
MKFTRKEMGAVLRRHGYKLTRQRRAVIEAIIVSQDRLTPAILYAKVHQDHPDIGVVTIYRTLEILAELALVCELHGGTACHRYVIGQPEQHHHHLICSGCSLVTDFTRHDFSALERSLARQSRFRIDGHLLEFFGLCPACQEKQSGP